MFKRWKKWKVNEDWTVHYMKEMTNKYVLVHSCHEDGVALPLVDMLICTECGLEVPNEVLDTVRKELENGME